VISSNRDDAVRSMRPESPAPTTPVKSASCLTRQPYDPAKVGSKSCSTRYDLRAIPRFNGAHSPANGLRRIKPSLPVGESAHELWISVRGGHRGIRSWTAINASPAPLSARLTRFD
jgi:hypothetical protein